MKFILGLTGQTGSGKSTLKSVAEKSGYFVIDCDKTAHNITSNSSEAKNALCLAFSNDILDDNGEICRKKLAKAAFASKEKTELLNKTVLPFIVKEIENIIENSSCNRIILDAPTLFESGINNICALTVAVLADENLRRQRIIARDGLTEKAAALRLKAAKSDEYYKQKADIIIYNNGSVNDFSNNFLNILNNISGGNCNV